MDVVVTMPCDTPVRTRLDDRGSVTTPAPARRLERRSRGVHEEDHMSLKGSSIRTGIAALVVALVGMTAPAVDAADATPPELVDVTASPADVSVSGLGHAVVTLSVHLRDPSGVVGAVPFDGEIQRTMVSLTNTSPGAAMRGVTAYLTLPPTEDTDRWDVGRFLPRARERGRDLARRQGLRRRRARQRPQRRPGHSGHRRPGHGPRDAPACDHGRVRASAGKGQPAGHDEGSRLFRRRRLTDRVPADHDRLGTGWLRQPDHPWQHDDNDRRVRLLRVHVPTPARPVERLRVSHRSHRRPVRRLTVRSPCWPGVCVHSWSSTR